MSRLPPFLLMSCGVVAALLPAQEVVRARAGVALVADPGPGGAIAGPQDKAGDDVGVAVELPENPNLDRYLRKAQGFLAAQRYDAAITVLQDVIEGRTIEAVDGSAPPDAANPSAEPGDKDRPAASAKATAQPSASKPATDPAAKPAAAAAADPRLSDPANTVFSSDGRMYRPVRRLCHELLATMPPVGIALYRTIHEVAAEELLQQALRDGSTSALEQVCNRYYVTLAAGRAMVVLADRLMHEGRYRAAVQVLRDLIEVYPADNRRQIGTSDLWCRFKIALCLRLAGELHGARLAATALADSAPDESLRIMGELQPVRELPEHPLFRAADNELVADVGPRVDRSLSWLSPGDADIELRALWQFRYREPKPYKDVKVTNANEDRAVFFGSEGRVVNAFPHATRFGTASALAFFGNGFPADRVVFFDYFRVRVADAFTGLLQAQGDGLDAPAAQPRANQPRARVPAYDHALYRPIEDEARYYAILGYKSASMQSAEVLKQNELVAYAKDTMQRAWTTADWLDGEDGYREVTFLAAPVLFGERLLAPVLRQGAYCLQATERETGRPLWRTRIHSGGSPFFKAPGTRVLVQGGVAYVLTNAGGLAAIDAFAGDLKWIRRYERRDPMRVRGKPTRPAADREGNYGVTFVQRDLGSWLPNDIIGQDGLVIIAPCDADVLLCLDGSSGEIVWVYDTSTPTRYAPFGRLLTVVGSDDKHVFATSETDLVCFGLRSGVCLWSRPLPVAESLTRWRGRGCVSGAHVLIPGAREVLVFPTDGKGPMRRAALPSFGEGPEPLGGPNNVFTAGPWLAVAYESGIEVFSTAAALGQLAAVAPDPVSRAGYLVQAGSIDAAIDVLAAALADGAVARDRVQQAKAAARLLSLARERALSHARAGAPDPGRQVLDRVLPFATDPTVRMNWHLARLDFWRQIGDMRAYEEEQQRLYAYMEGKR